MSMNPLPPQAYTKDTLVKAYNWLSNQAPHIKALATTTDVLVSLYLKAQRDGLSSLENPSIQNFKNELKALSSLMGDFENPKRAAEMQAAVSAAGSAFEDLEVQTQRHQEQRLYQKVDRQEDQRNEIKSETSRESADRKSARNPLPLTSENIVTSENALASENALVQDLKFIDQQSLLMIEEVRSLYNLPKNQDALRMLIKIGYVKAIGLYKSI